MKIYKQFLNAYGQLPIGVHTAHILLIAWLRYWQYRLITKPFSIKRKTLLKIRNYFMQTFILVTGSAVMQTKANMDTGRYTIKLLSLLGILLLVFILLSYTTENVPRYRSYNLPVLSIITAYAFIVPALLLSDPPFVATLALLVGVAMEIVTFVQLIGYFAIGTYKRVAYLPI